MPLILLNKKYILFFLVFFFAYCGFILEAFAYTFQPSIAMHGTPKYGPHFSSFDYVNVSAPNGGELKQAAFGSFDTFNPFTINGISPAGIGLTHDTLMKQSDDEAFSLYGLIADGIAVLPNNTGVAFHIHSQARFNDGSPITAEDVLFSFNILKEKGLPTFRYYYQDVDKIEVKDTQTIVFYFKPNSHNRELPFILGELPVLSKVYWGKRDFSKTSLDIPVSSGPYQIISFQPGRSITYEKNPAYWALDLNVNKGFYHFDRFKFDYYRDTTVAIEAFKAGEFDVRLENEAKKWVQFQEEKNVINGRIKMKSFPHQLPSGMQGFVFNLRRPLFQDKRVRQALSLAFDFDWMNQNLFHGLYQRTNSFFDNSYLKAPVQPDEAELKLLKPYINQLDPSIWKAPQPYKKQSMRKRLHQALQMLDKAGWRVQKDGILRNEEGEPFEFEILLDSTSAGAWERIILPFMGQLKKLGIKTTLRTVDLIQYKNRLDSFDYDMIVSVWGQTLSPGNEQRFFWGSEAANSPGSMNYSGVKSVVIDALIEAVIQAKTAEALKTTVHALDRVLMNEHIVIPHWFSPANRFMYWGKIGIPEQIPLKGANLLTWWMI